MSIIDNFVSRSDRNYHFKIGTVIASSLTGFIAGAVSISIVWYILLNFTPK